VTLTIGTGPFGPPPGGVVNSSRPGPAHVLYSEDSPRRVRTRFAGETVADSRRAKLLHETGLLPVYYFPLDDLRRDLLEPSDHTTYCPFKGEASYFTLSSGRTAENAVWSYEQPYDEVIDIKDRLAFYPDRVDSIAVAPSGR
jgi:uncharacterized protein (DUF427 family)